jgi:hypothetical protein
VDCYLLKQISLDPLDCLGSMSSGQFSSARSMDVKVPCYLEQFLHFLALFHGVSFSLITLDKGIA